MRSRRIKKQIWLNDEEEYIMKCKSQAVGMNASDYIRHLIVGYKPKEKPSEQFYEEIKNIRNIGNNINQIARISNSRYSTSHDDYSYISKKLSDFILRFEKEIYSRKK